MGGRASQYIKALADGAKIHPNELLGGMGGPGNIYFVIPSTAPYYDVLKRDYDFVNNDGSQAVQTSLAATYDLAVGNRNDLILLYGSNITHDLAAMLTVSKGRVNFAGWDLAGDRKHHQGARILMGVTTATTDLAPVLVTGTRNTFRNLKIENANTNNYALSGFIDAGEGTLLRNVTTLKTAGLDDANHCHFWMAGDSLDAKDVTFGQSNTPNTAAGFGIKIDGYLTSVAKENYLENVFIRMSVGGSVQATSCFIKLVDAAAMNFDNNIVGLVANNFIPVGGTIMTDAVLGATQTNGNLLIVNPSWNGSTGVGSAAGQSIFTANSGAVALKNGGLATDLSD